MEFSKPVFIEFIEKAFDSACTAAVLEALEVQGIEETHIRLLDDIYEGCTGRLILHKQSEKFPI